MVNVSGEQTVDGVTTLPANPPPVAGAVIRVDGTEVTSTNGSGAFSFNYTGTDDAVTVSATASGLGTWQLTNVSSTASGDVLTMMLNGHNTSRDVSPPATASGGTNTTAPIPATAPPEGSTTTTTPPPTTTGGGGLPRLPDANAARVRREHHDADAHDDADAHADAGRGEHHHDVPNPGRKPECPNPGR